MAIVATTAPCWNRLAMFSADGKVFGFRIDEDASSTTSARMAGSDPMSPPRTLLT